MLGKTKLLLRLIPGDEVYLKSVFTKCFKKHSNLLYRKEMSKFTGQRVKVTTTILQLGSGNLPTEHSFVCKIVGKTMESERFPLSCIDKSQPLIRNGRKLSLKEKELYTNLIQ